MVLDNKNPTTDEKSLVVDFTNNMTYSEYLQLDNVLSSQKRLSDHHDEMLFIIIHQVSELWMKLMIHELNAAIVAIKDDNLSSAQKCLARVSKTQAQIIQAWDVLSTLTPSEYMEFREALGQASGFQSYQNRMIEFALGYKNSHILQIYQKDPALHAELKKAYEASSIYDAAIHALHKAGFPIDERILTRDVTQSYKENHSVREAWISVQKHEGTLGAIRTR